MMAAEWYFRAMGAEFGPVSAAELVQQAADGRIGPDTEVRRGDGPWIPASKVAGLFDRAAQRKAAPARAVASPSSAPEEASVFVPSTRPPSPASPASGKFEVIASAEDEEFRVEILAYPSLG